MMKRLLPLVVVLMWGGAVHTLNQWDERRAVTEYLSVPPARTARAVGAGYDNMIADGLYLQFVYYFGRHMKRDAQFYNLAPVLELMTDMDPRFEDAYVMGAMALADNKQIDEAEALLEKGVTANPDDWKFSYDAGMNLFLFGETEKHYLKAAGYFKRAASLPDAPPEARYMEARMYHVTGRRDMIVKVWEDTFLNSPSKEARGVAERSLIRLKAPLPVRKQKRSAI